MNKNTHVSGQGKPRGGSAAAAELLLPAMPNPQKVCDGRRGGRSCQQAWGCSTARPLPLTVLSPPPLSPPAPPPHHHHPHTIKPSKPS
jgi:hypothetical protein